MPSVRSALIDETVVRWSMRNVARHKAMDQVVLTAKVDEERAPLHNSPNNTYHLRTLLSSMMHEV